MCVLPPRFANHTCSTKLPYLLGFSCQSQPHPRQAKSPGPVLIDSTCRRRPAASAKAATPSWCFFFPRFSATNRVARFLRVYPLVCDLKEHQEGEPSRIWVRFLKQSPTNSTTLKRSGGWLKTFQSQGTLGPFTSAYMSNAKFPPKNPQVQKQIDEHFKTKTVSAPISLKSNSSFTSKNTTASKTNHHYHVQLQCNKLPAPCWALRRPPLTPHALRSPRPTGAKLQDGFLDRLSLLNAEA